jgi:diguanylate cyclase (GGDEF)-like protein
MNHLVGRIASALAEAYPEDVRDTSVRVMHWLVDCFDVDAAFVRIHDNRRRTSTLFAEWPMRFDDPSLDPLAVQAFSGANAMFALQEHLKEAVEVGSEAFDDDYRALIAAANTQHAHAAVLAPLLGPESVTAGVLGLATRSGRLWTADDLATLTAVAAVLALFHGRVAAEAELRDLVDRDVLTRLPDRTALAAHLADRLAATKSAAVTAIIVKLANVSQIMDRLGHDGGDEFVAAVADRVRNGVPGSAAVFRASGDEFVVVPHEPGLVDARETAELLQVSLESPLEVHGEPTVPRVSIGIASGFADADTPATLVRGLKQAVRQAQLDVGNPISVLNRHIILTAGRRRAIELHIRGAIADRSLTVVYQPVVELDTTAIVGMEALVRWDHPTLGYLLPDSFLGVVESMDLHDELGELVLRAACSDASSWRASGLAGNAVLRVNVSPRQLVNPRFVDLVHDVLSDSGLPPQALCLEFTESTMLHDLLAVRALTEKLRLAGVGVAIDDFGTGFSSFTQLKALPVNALKIDRSFVRDVDTNRRDRAIVTAVVGIAKELAIDVVAEGVDTEAAAATLLELGCKYAQGYLFSPPISRDELGRRLAASGCRAR